MIQARLGSTHPSESVCVCVAVNSPECWRRFIEHSFPRSKADEQPTQVIIVCTISGNQEQITRRLSTAAPVTNKMTTPCSASDLEPVFRPRITDKRRSQVLRKQELQHHHKYIESNFPIPFLKGLLTIHSVTIKSGKRNTLTFQELLYIRSRWTWILEGLTCCHGPGENGGYGDHAAGVLAQVWFTVHPLRPWIHLVEMSLVPK